MCIVLYRGQEAFIVRENVRNTAKKRKKSRLFGFRKKVKNVKNVEVNLSNNVITYAHSPEDHGDHPQ